MSYALRQLEVTADTLDELRRRRDELIRFAREAGDPVAAIADAADLSRQHVYTILKEPTP